MTSNRQQSPHRLVPEGRGHNGQGRRLCPEPALPQLIPPKPAVVMETALAAQHVHPAGIQCSVWTGGGGEWSLQVRAELRMDTLINNELDLFKNFK